MSGFLLLAEINLQPVALGLLALFGALGLVAVISPRQFQRLAGKADHWVDSSRALECLDRRVDIDSYVLPRSRMLGIAVLVSVAILAYVVLGL